MRRAVVTFLTLIVLVALAVALTQYLTDESDAEGLTLAEVRGAVMVIGADAVERQGRAGELLSVEERVATRKESRAVLALGAETRIHLEPESTVQVLSVDHDEVRLELEDGLIQATVRPNSGAVRVGRGDRGVAATNADFRFGVGPDDTVGIELIEGDLMTTLGSAARLTAPTRVTVTSDGHAEIGPIRDDLVLEMQWPEARTNRKATTVTGSTTPGTRVRVKVGRGEDTRSTEGVADANGVFSVSVELMEGEQVVVVEAVDVMGREGAASTTISYKGTGPAFRGAGASYEAPAPRRP